MMGRPDAGDRIAQALVGIAALLALANGAFMLVDPFGWYEAVGTVKTTGPANAHFLRDIGLAYLVSAGLLLYAAGNLYLRWSSALAGSVWLLLHGVLHVWEVTSGICAPGIFWRDAPGVLGIPLLALAGAAVMFARSRVAPGAVPNALFFPLADRLTFGLSPHLPDFRAAPGHLAAKFRQFMALSVHGHAASPSELAMARLGAVMAEDCGPCVEIAARNALAAGVERDTINAALRRALPEGPESRAFAFAAAIATGDPAVGELGDEIEAERGRAVRTELTVAAAVTRAHPAFKRGLGFAQSCSARPFTV